VLGLDEALEQGTLRLPGAELLTDAWRLAMARALRRKLRWPAHVKVLAIGGSTLGGSGKTPLAIACAAELARLGASPVLVGHAHRAAPGFARVVGGSDPVERVGDEALVAARSLEGLEARVVVGPTRQSAIELAARLGRVLVLDGVSQTVPVVASLALLALDAAEPWGFPCALPPRGNLRALRSDLIEVCDLVVPVGDEPELTSAEWCAIRGGREVAPASLALHGARLASGALVSLPALAGARIGLIAALARPERVVRALARRGVNARVVLRAPDHGPVGARLLGRAQKEAKACGIGLWLATAKCSVHVARVLRREGPKTAEDCLGAPLATLEHSLLLSPPLAERLRRVAAP
jgi:tetraacyldisaccharide 4'-kinase